MTTNMETGEQVQAPFLGGPEDFHVYIANSESEEDRLVVLQLMKDLDQRHFRCLDPHTFYKQNTSEMVKLENGVMRSKKVILLLTKAYLTSGWSGLIRVTCQRKAEERNDSGFILLALHGVCETEIPPELTGYDRATVGSQGFVDDMCRMLARPNPPEMAVLPVGGIAKGLAWSYFYGYLNMLLPGLTDRYRKFNVWREDSAERVMPLKMFILLPASCYCPPSLSDVDDKFKMHDEKIPFSASRAGAGNRNYNTTVYSVTDDDNKTYYVQIEFATPVLSMWEMYEGGIAGMREQEKDHQLCLFHDVLKQILNHPENKRCQDKAVLLYYDDKDEGKQLSQIVLERIKLEIKRDLANSQHLDVDMDTTEASPTKGKQTFIQSSVHYDDSSREYMQRYDMAFDKYRGEALIINVLDGAEKDEETLSKLWKELGFNVKLIKNPTRNGIIKPVAAWAMADHSQYKCCVCCILSHGDLGVVYGRDDKEVKITDITHLFSDQASRTLAGKPKMFFISADQGKINQGKVGDQTTSELKTRFRAALVPGNKDFIMSYATLPGSTAHVDAEYGASYINALDRAIRKYRNVPGMDLERILKNVSEDVMENYKKSHEVPRQQMPFHLTTTNKLLYLSDSK